MLSENNDYKNIYELYRHLRRMKKFNEQIMNEIYKITAIFQYKVTQGQVSPDKN